MKHCMVTLPFPILKSKGKYCMAEKPSHVSRVSLSHLVEIRLKEMRLSQRCSKNLLLCHMFTVAMFCFEGVCSTDLQLDTSTNGLKHVYTSTQKINEKTYFLENVHLKIFKTFTVQVFVSNNHNTLKWHFYEQNCTFSKNLQYIRI
jgi:hypothetical protein